MLTLIRRGIKISFPFWNTARTLNLSSSSFSKLIDVHPNVQAAISAQKPVVALESTIITHGMPRPYNLETALEVEDIVAKIGSTPATTAIIDGRIKVGLTGEQLKRLANLEDAVKCSRRDLAYVLSRKLCAGTTVAGTLIIANMIGIKIFATGGIGGVHRDGHITFDISADLIELGRTPLAVISSGIKSILDIPRTLEYLETQGVLVACYNNPKLDFPAFYTRSSGVKVPYNLSNSWEAAELINSSLELNLKSGILIGVPIPEEYAISELLIKDAIDNSLKVAREEQVVGKDITPFVLKAVSNITKGKSLSSNMALIKNNASVASEIAVNLHKIQMGIDVDRKDNPKVPINDLSQNIPVVVVGASILDMCLRVNDADLKLDGATYPVVCKTFGGGVGRNVAEGLSKLFGNVHFISSVGNDEIGRNLKAHLPSSCQKGITISSEFTSSTCTVIFDRAGDCKLALGDMKIHQSITPELIIANEFVISKCSLIVMDGNIGLDTMGILLDISRKYNKQVFFEPTDMRIAGKPFQLPRELTQQIKFISPNIFELKEIVRAFNIQDDYNEEVQLDLHRKREEVLKAAKMLLENVKDNFDCIILTLGEHGVVITRKSGCNQHFYENLKYIPQNGPWKYHFYAVQKIKNLVNVSGAGDSFTSGFISAMLKGRPESECVNFGIHAAACALKSESAVPDEYFMGKEHDALSLRENAEYVEI